MSPASHVYVAVVDDDESIRRSMMRLLRAADFHAVPYASADQFLEDWKRPDFDCLVLDIWLADRGGFELQRQLAAQGSTAPVIFVTGDNDLQTKEAAEATQCAGFFRKCDDGTKIVELIRQLADAHERRSGKVR